MSLSIAPIGILTPPQLHGGTSASYVAERRPAATIAADDGQAPATAREKADAATGGPQELSAAEQRLLDDLKRRDREVRAHEAAHVAAGGSLVSPASFSYRTGPDGNRYAVGGEVSIDTGKEREPQATIQKMQIVVAAAMAPADPSGQDHSVASAAHQTSAEARMELAREQGAAATAPQDAEDGKTAAEAPASTNRQRQAVSGYAQAAATMIAQVTGLGFDVSA